jgi:gliding motility-associated lipoprotein GldH
MKTLLTIFATTMILLGCNTYREYDKESFPDYTWKRGKEIIFKPVIDDFSQTYNIALGIRHVYGLQLEGISVTIKTISPSGKETSADYDFQLMKVPGEYLGSCAGDICDLETVVDSEIKFEESGEYQMVITHNVQAEQIPGVIAFGLILNKN